MEQLSYYLNIAAAITVVVSWVTFGSVVVRQRIRSSGGKASERTRQPWLGLALQGVSIAVIWFGIRRPLFSPFFEGRFATNTILQVLAAVTSVASAWFAVEAIRELGRQWSLDSRLVEGHKLVMSGPYGVVRHPIYTAMLGLEVATSLVWGHWIALAVGLTIFLIATWIRISQEERLLSGAFGEEFENWKRRVPGLIPFTKL